LRWARELVLEADRLGQCGEVRDILRYRRGHRLA
jgi:hypothetical protein